MNPAEIDPSAPPRRAPAGAGGHRPSARLALLLLAIGALGAVAVAVGGEAARTALVDLGPTDSAYASGLREIEQDGDIFFRWSSVPSSSITIPVRFCGPGSIRLRVRRHFIDPAILTVFVGGSLAGQTSVRAREDHPYEVLEFPISKTTCDSDSSVILESSVENARPLGVAVDWLELRAADGFSPVPRTLARASAVLVIAALALLLAGMGTRTVALAALAFAGALGYGFSLDPVAGERILRGGLVALVLVFTLGVAFWRWAGLSNLSSRSRIVVVVLTLIMVLSRSLFLHPRIFYPDYRVHALVLQTLQSSGLKSFADHIFEIQYARSLGLQEVDGRWYPFPYPPGSYVLAQGVGLLSGLNAMDASLVTGIAAASAIPLVTVALGLILGLGSGVSMLGGVFVALHPLLVRRMALGYFPGLSGQLADAVSLLILVRLLKAGPTGKRGAVCLGGALVIAFLVYTQSIANFGLLIAGLLVGEFSWRRAGGLRSALLVGVVATLALGASIGAFYARYWPVAQSIARHEPLAESRVLDRLDELRRGNPALAPVAVEDPTDDPFVGAGLNPLRGLGRLGSRLWRFNGPFAFAILPGLWLLWRRVERTSATSVLAWGAVCLWISLLASGLPSPNGFQHLKDLEFSTPLMCLALGVLAWRLWNFRPSLGLTLVAAWGAFASHAYVVEVADRAMALYGR